MSDLIGEIDEVIQDRKLLEANRFVLVAVSGGLDSMVLLHTICHLADLHGWMPVVAHFNHQLRGTRANADEVFVKKAAAKLGLKCVTERGKVRGFARRHQLSIEMAARQLRHDFLARTSLSLGIRTVALGHHANDQAELFFLRLFRGAGSEGLAGMKWVSPSPSNPRIRLVRPFLKTPRQALEEFARREKIAFREDASNAQVDFERNRIRHELLPFIGERFQANLVKMTQRTMEILGAESDFVRQMAAVWQPETGHPRFEKLHTAIQRQVIHSELLKLGVAPEFDLIERLRCSAGVAVEISPQLRILRNDQGALQAQRVATFDFGAACREVELCGRTGEFTFAGLKISWRKEPKRREKGLPRFKPGSEWFDADKVGAFVHLRHWRPGDRFQPIGMERPVKVQDLFTNQKIPREERHRLVVATTTAGDLFWVEGLRISARFKLDKKTVSRLRWSWWREGVT